MQAITKDYRGMVNTALRQGWKLKKGGKHPKIVSPDGTYTQPIPTSGKGRCSLYQDFRKRLVEHGVEF